MDTKEILDKIFKDPKTSYELTDFEALGKPIHEILNIYPKAVETGRDVGKVKYYVKVLYHLLQVKKKFRFFDESGKSNLKRLYVSCGYIN